MRTCCHSEPKAKKLR